MLPSHKNRFGRVNMHVTAFSFGTAPIGNFLQQMSETVSNGMVEAAWDAGVRYFRHRAHVWARTL
jgi:D-threo-aldose 1-dehydrogenase